MLLMIHKTLLLIYLFVQSCYGIIFGGNYCHSMQIFLDAVGSDQNYYRLWE